MKKTPYSLLPVCLVWLQAVGFEPDPPITCSLCEQWNVQQEPFRLFGNTYYVGTGLSSLLIVTEEGLILLDAGLPQSAPLIDAHIARLGFNTRDIRVIINSHPHFDHAGGIAAMQRESGAVVLASPKAEQPLMTGHYHAEDPQLSYGDTFPPTTNIRVISDGETLQLGNQSITARFTPGHTPGGTSWTWQSCEGDRCLNMVYADSLTAVSAPGYRFTEHPEAVEALRDSIEVIASLPCDILVSTHPEASDLFGKYERSKTEGVIKAFVSETSCMDYAAGALSTLQDRLTSERGSSG